MMPRKRTSRERDELLRKAEAVVDHKSSRLSLNQEVMKIRNPQRSRPGWRAPELTIDPATFARISLKEAVALGLLEEIFSDPDLGRASRDRFKAVAKDAQKAKASLASLLANLELMQDRLGDVFFHGFASIEGAGILENVQLALDWTTWVVDRSEEAATRRAKTIRPAGDPFRRAFTAEMARVYYLLTGLLPSASRTDCTPFVLFVDAAMQAIFPDDQSTCAGVLRTALPEFRRDLKNGYLEERRTELWVVPKLRPDQETGSIGDEPSAQ
jgi:hypothetical protein